MESKYGLFEGCYFGETNPIKNNILPADMPRNPDFTYKNNGWKGWSDFLGTGTKPRSRKN
jgi:hypothetical protein